MQLIRRILDRMTRINQRILLLFMYAGGIGPIKLLATLTGKKFLNLTPEGGTWEAAARQHNSDLMF